MSFLDKYKTIKSIKNNPLSSAITMALSPSLSSSLLIDACNDNDYQKIINIIDKMTESEKAANSKLWFHCCTNNKLNSLRALLDKKIFKFDGSILDKYRTPAYISSNWTKLVTMVVNTTYEEQLDSFWYEHDLIECLISMTVFKNYAHNILIESANKSRIDVSIGAYNNYNNNNNNNNK